MFAGSGINKIENSGDFIFGSPLLIGTLHKFKKMFFCERISNLSNVLKERLKAIGKKENEGFSIFSDCNTAIDEIIKQIKHGHSLIFIDPFGAELEWKTMEKILQLRADIILNFQTTQIARIRQQGKLGKTMENFFKSKEPVEKIYNTLAFEGALGEHLLSLYIRDIIDTRSKIDLENRIQKKTIIGLVRIKKDNRFFYDLIFIVRETKEGNPWLKAIIDAKEEIENLQEKDVRLALDVLSGRQRTLMSIK